MLKAALIGLGRMGRGHYNVYKQFEKDGVPVKLVAVCDIDEAKFRVKDAAQFNLEQVAQADTPRFLNFSSDSKLSQRGSAPVAMINALQRISSPEVNFNL